MMHSNEHKHGWLNMKGNESEADIVILTVQLAILPYLRRAALRAVKRWRVNLESDASGSYA